MAVKIFFAERGFTEIYGYTFAVTGEVALENPLSSDKVYLRTDLATGLGAALKFNRKHLLFETEKVRLFEIGNVFTAREEMTHLAFGLGYGPKGRTLETDDLLTALWTFLGVSPQPIQCKDEPDSVIIELDWGKLAALVTTVPVVMTNNFIKSDFKFKPYSLRPRIVRDVALFVPSETVAEMVEKKIYDLAEKAAGELLTAGPILFDTFEKADKKSLAFRLVFQALDRTLTDDEVNEIMTKITGDLSHHKDWQLR